MRVLLLISSALLANAFISNPFAATAKCLKAGTSCAGIAGPTGECCSGLQCVYEGPDRASCRGPKKVVVDVQVQLDMEDSTAKCLAQGALCSGIAGPVGTCCSGLRCVNEGPDRSICRGPKKLDLVSQTNYDFVDNKCLAQGALCSGIAGPVGTCCSGLRCVSEGPDRSTCRGPKRLDFESEDDFTNDKCLAAGSLCAGIAGPTGSCCAPLKCVYDSPDHAMCRGLKYTDTLQRRAAAPLCIKKDNTCASENGRYPPCCSGLDCTFDDPADPNHGTCRKPAAALCTKKGNTCASENGRFAACCNGLECTFDDPADPAHGTCRKPPAPICVKRGNTCASANGRFAPCCEGSTCVNDDPADPAHGTCRKQK